jgi:glycerol-3-phosphate dehydrogenase (NAD(P)+)
LVATEERIAIIGSGGFGTVLAKMLAENDHTVYQWVRNAELAAQMETQRVNPKYLNGFKLPLNLWITTDLAAALADATIVVAAVPSFAMRETMQKVAPHLEPGAIVLNVAKGIEHGTFRRMSEVIREEAGDATPVATMSGPNLAEELARQMPAGTIVASEHKPSLPRLTRTFSTSYFKVFAWTDVVGTELGGVMKNITAIAAGISDGLGFGNNSKSSLIALGLQEMFTVGHAMGARRNTFYGLAGLGDLVATCSSSLSRNHFVGEHLAAGDSMDAINGLLNGKVAEGVNATRFVHDYAEKNKIALPLTKEMYHILYEGKPPKAAISDLLKAL